MRDASPLRYPGGKSALASLLAGTRRANGLSHLPIAEPFAGGAGASFSLLCLEEVPEILINDADPAIYDFWWALLRRPRQFLALLRSTPVTITEWRQQRLVYLQIPPSSKVSRGFSAFYLNRCNRSGIIVNGGPIGGHAQAGLWRLNARFNKPALISRCQRLTDYRLRIRISNLDAIAFIDHTVKTNTFLFIDPPYYHKGRTLYLDVNGPDYHAALAAKLRQLADSPWILTYDDCPEIRRLYRSWATIRPFLINYAAATRRAGREVLIAPKWMQLPLAQCSKAISW